MQEQWPSRRASVAGDDIIEIRPRAFRSLLLTFDDSIQGNIPAILGDDEDERVDTLVRLLRGTSEKDLQQLLTALQLAWENSPTNGDGDRGMWPWPLWNWRQPSRTRRLVYAWCMSRTNIDLDDEACRAVMERYQLSSKRDAVNFALRTLAAEALTVEEARGLRGSGWDGDLDELRTSRAG